MEIILKIFILTIVVLFITTLFYKNYIEKNFNTKLLLEFIVPISILVISVMCFFTYTYLNDPYSIAIQTLVLSGIFIFNFGIFWLYKVKRKLSFICFIFNCLLIFTYIRFFIETTVSFVLTYYLIIFLGFHIFEKTFTKMFYLRTLVIIKEYYKNFEILKIILWVFLIFIPSLLKEPIIIVSVVQPLLLYCYFNKHDYILFFFLQ